MSFVVTQITVVGDNKASQLFHFMHDCINLNYWSVKQVADGLYETNSQEMIFYFLLGDTEREVIWS